jgi:hypothetical protein
MHTARDAYCTNNCHTYVQIHLPIIEGHDRSRAGGQHFSRTIDGPPQRVRQIAKLRPPTTPKRNFYAVASMPEVDGLHSYLDKSRASSSERYISTTTGYVPNHDEHRQATGTLTSHAES